MGTKMRTVFIMAKNRILLYVVMLASASLACGISTLPESNVVDGIPTSQEVEITSTSEPVQNQYIVTAETLRMRDGAGEEFANKGYLPKGEIVTCLSIDPAEDGGRWCRHDKGWSNLRYMVQK